jgi:hypothetical protein
MRQHRANEAKPLRLVPANRQPPGRSEKQFAVQGEWRIITANGIPDHLVGAFPNAGNPNVIQPQHYSFQVPAHPQPAAQITWLHHQGNTGGPPNMPFGIALTGVLFDPGTAEFWMGDREANWNYEALGGAVALGLDEQHAHEQPNGAYHYHAISHLVMDQLALAPDQHCPLVGWAADGFPIYALRGYKEPRDASSGMMTLRSSYALRKGDRPRPPEGPGGKYDGAFIQDYEFVAGSGDLDECNGRFCVTPDFPEGTYAYFMTMEWPVIPRAFRGTPVVLRGPPGMDGVPGGMTQGQDGQRPGPGFGPGRGPRGRGRRGEGPPPPPF